MTRPEPTILDRLQVGGLRPEIVAEFRARRRKRTPCQCRLCSADLPRFLKRSNRSSARWTNISPHRREIAGVLGVGKGTVSRDVAPDGAVAQPNESQGNGDSAPFGADQFVSADSAESQP